MRNTTWLVRISQQEAFNFLLTNRIPRHLATRFMGWFSRIEQPLVRDLSLAIWRAFAPDLDLTDAKKRRFDSLHDCFIRELNPGARPVDADPNVIVSPCDAEVGTRGHIDGTRVYQAKGFPYTLRDLLGDDRLVARYRGGRYVTLRLRSTMYHRFHAPCDARLREVIYISGDTWNVNPIALKRIERLYCRNERAVLDLQLPHPRARLALVPVAAILVASIRVHCLGKNLDLRYQGPNRLPCHASFAKGEEIGYFQHGSTMIVLASDDFRLHESILPGTSVSMGQPLLIINSDSG